ncbi:hypothetical protein O3M35_005189 [Rhynocoris fuscipes]|uniref:Uncharacterized protein n=1 Tax=Rhynocoris fuscipes TaxID=488301 RepID=A0AAW1DHD0_9HEMI
MFMKSGLLLIILAIGFIGSNCFDLRILDIILGTATNNLPLILDRIDLSKIKCPNTIPRQCPICECPKQTTKECENSKSLDNSVVSNKNVGEYKYIVESKPQVLETPVWNPEIVSLEDVPDTDSIKETRSIYTLLPNGIELPIPRRVNR